jgi:acetylornithine deacetylase/succinyl-diaminopimelate desuccinylase-like protein
VLTGDEEVGSRRGIIPLLESGLVSARRAICGEPTGLDVFLGNRGLVWAKFSVLGRGGHAGQLAHLDDPVPPALTLIEKLRELPLDAYDDRFDPPRPSLAVTRIDAGAGMRALNIVPDRVEVGIDRRLLPGEDVDAVIAALRGAEHDSIGPPFRCEFDVQRGWPPYAIAADDETALLAFSAAASVRGSPSLGMDSAANDSSWLHQYGVETVLLGPGAPPLAHVTDEHIDADQLADAVRIYARIGASTHPAGGVSR